MFPRAACLVALCLLAACGGKPAPHVRSGPMEPPAFWVWHRSSLLKPVEIESLRSAGVRELAWQVAEGEWLGDGWRFNRIAAPLPEIPDVRIVPVFRIKPDTRFLGSPASATKLADEIRLWNRGATPGEVQLDFDCPDRLLGDYARFLHGLAGVLSPCKVSITALAAWPRNPAFLQLAESVCSFAPMFYDLSTDAPDDVRGDRFQPMADPAVADLIALWKDCPKPWRAGLPNFERVSVFEPDGKLIGHLRGWRPDEVFFHPSLRVMRTGGGCTVFEVTASSDLADTRIRPGMKVVHRTPDLATLKRLVETADRSGADAVIAFALPGPGIQAACSAAQFTHLDTVANPTLRPDKNGVLILENPGPADLTSRIWELEIHSSKAAAFQSASPGGFAGIEVPGGLPPELSSTLVLRFSQLPAGGSLSSGPLVRDAAGLTWSIRGLTPEQALKPADSAR